MTFSELNLIEPLLQAIAEKGYTEPTPIQRQAIPHVLAGHDLVGCAQTGTGKTAAFVLPLMQRMVVDGLPAEGGPRKIRTLILTPTRELAAQIDSCCRDYGTHLPLRHGVIFGGVSQLPQKQMLREGVDLLIATPGRLLDMLFQRVITLDDLRYFVLDEADRMLDMGFILDIRRLMYHIPDQRQTLFFSATMPDSILRLAESIVRFPHRVSVAPPASTVDTITQRVIAAEKEEKRELLTSILRERSTGSVLVFSRTKHGADRIAKILNRAGIGALAIHGDKSQGAREKAMNGFRDGTCRVLIATDLASRGIDIAELPLVINYDLPREAETYVHRIGRTGRAGAAGEAISFCSEEERPLLADIMKLTGLRLVKEEESGTALLVKPKPEIAHKPEHENNRKQHAPRTQTSRRKNRHFRHKPKGGN